MAKLGNILRKTEDPSAEVGRLFKKLHNPGVSPGDIIEELDAYKQYIKPEDIINNSLKLDSEYAIMLLQLVDGSEVPVDLSKLRFQLDKIESAEYRIKLLHYIGSVNDGFVTELVPDPELNPVGTTSHAEGVTADEDGNLYAAEVAETNIRKFTRR